MLTNIPLLEASDIECRVQSVSKNRIGRVGAVLLIYKDARVDMRVLDEVFGPFGWKRTHEVIDGKLFCNIDIWDNNKKEWVRKQDVGVESNAEKEKGQASDAFKRAGFNVGIGRELYTAPFIYIDLNEGEYYIDKVPGREVVKTSPGTKFRVTEIAYSTDRKITKLVVVDKQGQVRYKYQSSAQGPVEQSKTPPQRPAAPKPTSTSKMNEQARNKAIESIYSGLDNSGGCPMCGGPITEAERSFSKKMFGKELCRKCQQAANAGGQ